MPRKITPQFLLTKLKRRLGTKSMEISFNDSELLDILYDESLPTFSIYFPAVIPMKIKLSDCVKARYDTNGVGQRAYHLPIPDIMNVIDIQSVENYNYNVGSYYAPPMTFEDGFDIFNAEIQQGMMESMMSTPITYEYIQPDILVIDAPGYIPTDTVRIEFLAEHNRDLSTIQFSYLDWLVDLFTLDCKIFLYEDMKHHDKIDTTFQQIDLKIDDWQNAKSERDDLINKFEARFLSHRKKTIYRV